MYHIHTACFVVDDGGTGGTGGAGGRCVSTQNTAVTATQVSTHAVVYLGPYATFCALPDPLPAARVCLVGCSIFFYELTPPLWHMWCTHEGVGGLHQIVFDGRGHEEDLLEEACVPRLHNCQLRIQTRVVVNLWD